jgi:hypothetical protein
MENDMKQYKYGTESLTPGGASELSDPMIGQRFGYLTVRSRYVNTVSGARQYNCVCICGRGKLARAGNLRGGRTKSCGCIKAGLTEAIGGPKPFVEQMRANFYAERPANGKQCSFVMVKDVIGQRVKEKTEHGYFLTTCAYRPTTPGRINTIIPIMMKRLYEAGIIAEQGKRTISAWMHDEGILFTQRMRGSAQYLANEHAQLSKGVTDECN